MVLRNEESNSSVCKPYIVQMNHPGTSSTPGIVDNLQDEQFCVMKLLHHDPVRIHPDNTPHPSIRWINGNKLDYKIIWNTRKPVRIDVNVFEERNLCHLYLPDPILIDVYGYYQDIHSLDLNSDAIKKWYKCSDKDLKSLISPQNNKPRSSELDDLDKTNLLDLSWLMIFQLYIEIILT